MAVGSCKLQAVGVAESGPRIVTVSAVRLGRVVLPTKDAALGCVPSAVVLTPPVNAAASEQVNVLAFVMPSSQAELALRAVALVAFGI